MSCISIVIPTKNAGSSFRQTLEAIYAQDVPLDLEVIVVDSGSTDATLSICQEFPLTLLTIPPETFSHSQTRNDAIRHASGELVILTVQDAQPAGPLWLKHLIEPLQKDPRIAGAYSRQVPRPEADFYTRRMFEVWGVSSTQPMVREIEDLSAYRQLSWEQKSHVCVFSNVSSVIRSSVWEEIPFPPVEYAEDLAWAREVLEQGYRLAYAPDSVVVHSHHRSWMEHLRRAYIDGKVLPQIFDADVPFPGEEAMEATAQLLYHELQSDHPLSEAAWHVHLEGAERLRSLSARSIKWLLSPASPWIAKASADRKRAFFERKVFEELVKEHKRVHTAYRTLVRVWLRAISWPIIGRAAHRLFLRRFGPLLAEMWGPWILFWGILSGHIDAPLPVDLTNRLLSYAQTLSPVPEEERRNVWRHVLVSVGGKYLGQSAWAAASKEIDSPAMQRIDQWLMDNRDQP